MESDDEVLLSSPLAGDSPPVRQQRKLKRLKKAIRVSQDLRVERSELEALTDVVSEEIGGENGSDSGFDGPVGEVEGYGAKRALDFEGLAGEFDEEGEDRSNEMGNERKEVRIDELEKRLMSGSESEEFNDENGLDSGFDGPVGEEDGYGAKRALDFEGLAGDSDEEGEDRSNEIGKERKEVRIDELEKRLLTGSESEEFNDENGLDSSFTSVPGEEEGSRAEKSWDFKDMVGEFDESREDRSDDIGEESEDVRMEELVERQSPDRVEEEKSENNKKRKKRVDNDGSDDNIREKPLNKRRSEKERRDHLKQLHAESQRLLRETSDATFKPVPFVQKPISSVLEKIRQRKLEISKKSIIISDTSFSDDDDELVTEVIVKKKTKTTCIAKEEDNIVSEASNKDTVARPTEGEGNMDVLNRDEANDSTTDNIHKVSDMAIDEEPKQEFRAPIDDTQDLFSESQTSGSVDETPSSPLEEIFIPSVLPLNLELDSALPDDDESSDEEYNDKENVNPHPHRSADLSPSPIRDPVKAFLDVEAEEEDDSDNDLERFKEDDEDEYDDIEELNEMIATGYEEKPIDNERRNELHQQWLEQQDAASTENFLQKLKHGSKVREPTLIQEEDHDSQQDVESDDDPTEALAPSNLVKINMRKVKQMMPQMFTDNNDGYLSSDDEETDKKLAKQCLLDKAEDRVTFFSPAEDESSREVFSRIKKLNIVPDSKKRAKPQNYFDTSHMGINRSISSKSSFLGRGSSHCLPSSKKQGSTAVRSFIFEREDSNSKSAISVSEESSETIQNEVRSRTISAKFISSQTRTFTQKSLPATRSDTSLLDILKRNSFASKRCTFDNMVAQTESILSSFKLAKKPVKSKEDGNL